MDLIKEYQKEKIGIFFNFFFKISVLVKLFRIKN